MSDIDRYSTLNAQFIIRKMGRKWYLIQLFLIRSDYEKKEIVADRFPLVKSTNISGQKLCEVIARQQLVNSKKIQEKLKNIHIEKDDTVNGGIP